MDFFSKEVVRIWLALDFNEREVNEVGDDEVGERPEWLRYELENLGWKDILGLGYSDEQWLRWGLDEGITHNQPFLVELPHPCYYTSHGDGGVEYDVSFEPDIIRVSPMNLKRVAVLLERARDDIGKARAWKAEREEKHRHLVRTDVKSMFIESTVYFGQHQPAYDDMASPSGIRYDLCSNASSDKRVRGRWRTATLVQGEDDRGDADKAFERLVEKAMKELPGLSAETIRALPRRSSNW